MTDSKKSFIQVKLWFSKLMNLTIREQEVELRLLKQQEILNKQQLKLLNEMLVADNLRKLQKTQIASTKIPSVNLK
jgi:hypothetical protein